MSPPGQFDLQPIGEATVVIGSSYQNRIAARVMHKCEWSVGKACDPRGGGQVLHVPKGTRLGRAGRAHLLC